MVNTRSQTKMADNADLLALLAEMKKSMEKGQEEMKEEMRKGQEGMKEEMRKGQEEMKNQIQSHVESKVGEIKDHVNSCIEKIEDVQSVRDWRDLTYSRPTVKSLTFDGQTSWTVFKTQFDVVSSANGWNNRVKASQLVASLRGTAAEVLQGIPSDKLTDLMTIKNALEARFRDSH
ncbi:hypothetical protein AVEN_238444-1 [Araneus ventricosus]|uniref:Uncharacterized protein n=1 Tax=Araneus ventricosus TaxID=182803 RepID=A0A4Y2P4Z9_ARAVE|nr:hypothetical protein AVEN_227649-1 [Araneus ventricosus]GBL80560.1 hypothetical protein AVEN_44977-1 [Araneus ventricosus]GBL80627.1 hypothetical protein AVEN_124430-1 [Araneus ventricosus]GBL80746.1 hypothetical protein AVEN_210491-1 [Araneus ventricosus]GBN45360.1 hypothetical protein AVEN_25126-1 [Araneus ventricosus]